MEEVKYIMVTNWDLHWDNLGPKWNNSTLYTFPIIKDNLGKGEWPSDAKTLFIKKTKSNQFEKSWIGVSKNFRRDPNNGKPAIRFDVSNLKEIDCPEQYKNYSLGWHLNKSTIPIVFRAKNNSVLGHHLKPPFFEEMGNCDPYTFELYCFYLLRLLGVHDLHKFPQDDNRGKADGFFRFHSLSVIYDATLESNFQRKKETQIENYISQLKKEQIAFNSLSYTIKDTQRQVWIITRGITVTHIKTVDHIKVKEIPVTKLIEVYKRRLNEEIGIEELCDILKDLE